MDRSELVELYKLAHAEYRAEVALGWERQKLFLTLNLALIVIVSAFGGRDRFAVQVALFAGAIVSIAGVLVVRRSHERYRATRTHLDGLTGQLGMAGFETTGGMRHAHGKPRGERFRVVTVVTIVLGVFVLLDIALALFWGRS
jgi:hypothetical protein